MKIIGGDIILEAGKISDISCKASLGYVDGRRPKIFLQTEFELPEGICCMDTLVALKRGVHNYFKIPITNNTNSNITLSKNTEMGRLEYINFINSFDLQLKEQQHASVNTATSSIDNQGNSIF